MTATQQREMEGPKKTMAEREKIQQIMLPAVDWESAEERLKMLTTTNARMADGGGDDGEEEENEREIQRRLRHGKQNLR